MRLEKIIAENNLPQIIEYGSSDEGFIEILSNLPSIQNDIPFLCWLCQRIQITASGKAAEKIHSMLFVETIPETWGELIEAIDQEGEVDKISSTLAKLMKKICRWCETNHYHNQFTAKLKTLLLTNKDLQFNDDPHSGLEFLFEILHDFLEVFPENPLKDKSMKAHFHLKESKSAKQF